MADPEGNDFCAFVRPPDRMPAYRLHGIGIDCRDAEAQARWWGELFGAEPAYEPEHDCWTLTGIAVDERMTLDFAAVPEPRTEPNRVHWDVQGDVGRCSLAARATCGTSRGGRCSPTLRATSSASSRPPRSGSQRALAALLQLARRFLDLGLVVRLAGLVVDLLGDRESAGLLHHSHASAVQQSGAQESPGTR